MVLIMKQVNAIYYFKKLIQLCLIYFTMFVIVFFSKEFSDGIKNGMNVSLNLVIPSLFIFMIFSNVIMNSNLCQIIAYPFRFLAKYVFKIDKQYLSIVILSLLGGYPIGAKLLCNAVKQDNMPIETAERMLCYCVNCGPAFLISAVGMSIFGDIKVGVILYLSQISACIIVGFLTSLFVRKQTFISQQKYIKKNNSASVLLVNAVNDTIKSMVVICGFIVAFSAFLPIIQLLTENMDSNLRFLLQGFLEVTTGCNNLANTSSPSAIILASAFTSFGGVCVYLQVCAMLKGSQVRLWKFFVFRIIYMFISITILKIFLSFSPSLMSCMSINTQQSSKIYSVSPAATIFMLLLSIILLFFSRKSDKMKQSG